MFGISAPRMAVRAAIPWYWRWLGLIVLASIILVLSRVAYDSFGGLGPNESTPAPKELSSSQSKLQQEAEMLRGYLMQSERQLQIERAAYADLVRQVKALGEENAALKEDVAFFQTLMPAGSKEGGVAINRFLVQNDALPGEYRYRLLLTQTGQRAKDFQGYLQFVVSLQENDRKVVMTLPAEGEQDSRSYRLNFRFYQRIEGTFRVAPNAVVKSMQVRVFESGSAEPRLTQTAHAS